MTQKDQTLTETQARYLAHIDQWQAKQEKRFLRAVENRLTPTPQATIDKALASIRRIADKQRAKVINPAQSQEPNK